MGAAAAPLSPCDSYKRRSPVRKKRKGARGLYLSKPLRNVRGGGAGGGAGGEETKDGAVCISRRGRSTSRRPSRRSDRDRERGRKRERVHGRVDSEQRGVYEKPRRAGKIERGAMESGFAMRSNGGSRCGGHEEEGEGRKKHAQGPFERLRPSGYS